MALIGGFLQVIIENLQAVLVFTLVFLVLYYYLNLPSNLPPGPPTLPVLGCLPFVVGRGHVHKLFTKWRAEYGDVIGIYMGNQLLVILGSHDVIKEAFIENGDAVSGRMKSFVHESVGDLDGGVVNTEGPPWKEQRRFALSSLRDFGMGKHSLEHKIHEELQFFTEEVKKKDGQAFDITFLMNKAISNIICSIVFGERYDYEDEYFNEMIELLHLTVKNAIRAVLTNRIPLIRYLPGDPTRYRFFSTNKDNIKNWVMKSINAHVTKFDPACVFDFIDAFLKQKEENKEAGLTDSAINDGNMTRMIIDLFAAGTETTSTTLRWALLFMMLHPDVQDRVQAEIDDVIGADRLPSLQDRTRMPFTEAVTLEISRMASIVPFAVPHRCTEKFTLRGYTIPANTLCLSNIYAVHMDPTNFPQPEVFRPERFLSEDGRKIRKSDFLIPFGIGRRSCLGESLAKMELFLCFSAFLQRFSLRLPEGAQKPDLDNPILGMTLAPPDYELCATYRRAPTLLG